MGFGDLFGFLSGGALALIAIVLLVGFFLVGGIVGTSIIPIAIILGILFLLGSLIGFSSIISIFSGIFGGQFTTLLLVVGAIVLGIFVLKTIFSRGGLPK